MSRNAAWDRWQIGSVGLSADERTIYYTRVTSEADIWLLIRKWTRDPT